MVDGVARLITSADVRALGNKKILPIVLEAEQAMSKSWECVAEHENKSNLSHEEGNLLSTACN